MAGNRPGEVQRIAIAADLARERLGWSAATSLEEGLRLTAEWAREEAA